MVCTIVRNFTFMGILLHVEQCSQRLEWTAYKWLGVTVIDIPQYACNIILVYKCHVFSTWIYVATHVYKLRFVIFSGPQPRLLSSQS